MAPSNISHVRIKIISTKPLHHLRTWDKDINGNQITPGHYTVTEKGTTCNFTVEIHTTYLGDIMMESNGVDIPLKDRRIELDLTRKI